MDDVEDLIPLTEIPDGDDEDDYFEPLDYDTEEFGETPDGEMI